MGSFAAVLEEDLWRGANGGRLSSSSAAVFKHKAAANMKSWAGGLNVQASKRGGGRNKAGFFLRPRKAKVSKLSQSQLVQLEHLTEACSHQAPGTEGLPTYRALSNLITAV